MRVTKQSLINSFLNNLQRTNDKLFSVNSQISSGKRVNRPEDDAIAASAITVLNARIAETKQYNENILSSLSELNTVDSTLGEISSILIRARELAVSAANDSQSASERDAIAVEVNQLLESMVQIGNTTMGGKSLFSGHESIGSPFEVIRGSEIGQVNDIVTVDGELRTDLNINNITSVWYQGDNQKTGIEVDKNLVVSDNLTGQELFFYDSSVSNANPSLKSKSVPLEAGTLLENIWNARDKQGVSAGYIYLQNTRGMHLSADTDEDPAVDNSTPLKELNNRRGVGRDAEGNLVSFGNIKLVDSAGASLVVDPTVLGGAGGTIDLTSKDATIQDVVDYLNWTTDSGVNPGAPKLRFSLEGNSIQVTDNANGTGKASISDYPGVNDGTWGAGALTLSTFAEDLGLVEDLQPKTIDSAQTKLGAMNNFSGINFGFHRENLKGVWNFSGGESVSINGFGSTAQMTVDDGAGNKCCVHIPQFSGNDTGQEILDKINSEMGLSLDFTNLVTAPGPNESYMEMSYSDGTVDHITMQDIATVPATTVSGGAVPLIDASVTPNFTMDSLMVSVRNRLSSDEWDGKFTVSLSDGSSHSFNLGQTNLTQNSTLDDVIAELNLQSTASGGFNGFQLSADGQQIELTGTWPANVDTVYDNEKSTLAFDLGLDRPAISMGFPNVSQSNVDFPGLVFDENTSLGFWLKGDMSSAVASGQVRIQDSTGQETFVDVSSLGNNSTVGDLVTLLNSSGTQVKAELSPDGYGLKFIDTAEGTGRFVVEDFGGSSLVSTLAIGTPLGGASGEYDGGAGVLVDLSGVGNTVLTVEELLEDVNSQIEHVGVKASLADDGSFIFEDFRSPGDRGRYAVQVENAIGNGTALESLNDGGGVNNYKIRITDSDGVNQIIDFRDAETVEDVINSINTHMEPVTEKTRLREIEALSIPMGQIEVSSSTATVTVDLSSLSEVSTVQDLVDTVNAALGPNQMQMSLNIDEDTSGVFFEFEDLKQTGAAGTISIKDLSGGTTAQELKWDSVAEYSPFSSGTIIHKRVDVTAMFNDTHTGIKIVDNKGGELKISEVEGRTTAHDLGLISNGTNVSHSINGTVVGSDLEVFQKVADEMGVSKETGIQLIRNEDTLTSIVNVGAMNEQFAGVQSKALKTVSLSTLEGAVDLDPSLTMKTKLSSLNNAYINPDYTGNRLENIDMTGVLKIENLNDDGTGNYESIQIDFQQLPDNATLKDLERLVQSQIQSDTDFHAKVDLSVTEDGEIKFNSDIPIRISLDTAASTNEANTATDLFGSNSTDFQRTLITEPLGMEQEYLGGVDQEAFYINDARNQSSFKVDLNDLASDRYGLTQELTVEDLKEYIEYNSRKPSKLTPDVLLVDLGIELPLNIPVPADAALPAPQTNADTLSPFNGLSASSTLKDFMDCFNSAPADSVFNGTVQLEIADGSNSTQELSGRALVVRDLTGLAVPNPVQLSNMPPELNQLFSQMGVQLGGNTEYLNPTGDVGIMGDSITGLGYDLDFTIDSSGTIAITSEDPSHTGRLSIVEGGGNAASDLKLIAGTGSIGNGTESIQSGNLNPGVDGETLLSDLSPKSFGKATSFEALLADMYVENGNKEGFIELLENPPVFSSTPFKALNNGYYDDAAGVYRGGVDVGRPASGFVLEDQYGNKAIVDLSNNLSRSLNAKDVSGLTAAAAGAGTSRFSGAAGDFSGYKAGDFFEVSEDLNLDGLGQPQSNQEKYEISAIAADGSWVEVKRDISEFDTSASNYSLKVFGDEESLFASMEKEYTNKPFYSGESSLTDLQTAIDIAIDKAKRTTGFGVDRIEVETNTDGTFSMTVVGENGPTVVVTERDTNNDGQPDSSTAEDLALLREVGAKGNGSPNITSGKIEVAATMSYLLEAVNSGNDVDVTASIGNNGAAPTLDLTSNSNSSYIKVRDSLEGNTASQTGLTSTRSIFQTLIDFRDALYRNDPDTISDQVLTRLKEDEEKVLQYRAEIGSVVNRFERDKDRLANTNVELVTRLSDNQDLDLTEAIMELRQLELAQSAALNIGARALQQTLLDFLG
jgi:flagellar hook-associated protein 3